MHPPEHRLLEARRWQDPRASVVLQLAKALKCHVEDIFSESDEIDEERYL